MMSRRSLRDIYPNLTGSLTTPELTIPEAAELNQYGPTPTGTVETTPGVAKPIQTGSTFMGILGVVAVLGVVAFFVSGSK
jgi:hypothetical protein